MTKPRAVLFDVDFTLCRPGPELSAERYARIAERHGVELDVSGYEEARATAALNLKRHPELLHDDSIWHAFTMDVFIAMGGPPAIASELALEIERGWEISENFEVFEDVPAVLDVLRANELRIGLVSNGIRDLAAFCAHHRVDVDAIVDSRTHGYVKPHPTIFEAALERLRVRAEDAVMVGDSIEEDVEGARALGMQAILVDRDDRYPQFEGRLTSLYELPAALGLEQGSDPAGA